MVGSIEGRTVPKYEVGDVVEMKSGGPNMTIKHVRFEQTDGSIEYRCYWISNAILYHGDFPEDMLVKKKEAAVNES